jgi:hypothetical protein
MNLNIKLLIVILCLLLLGCSENLEEDGNVNVNKSNPTAIANNLDQINKHQILFGHHSVGDNILSGIRQLANEQSTSISISNLDIKEAAVDGIHEFRPGKNQDPKSKISDFVKLIDELEQRKYPDLILMKFCYVDFNPNSNESSLYKLYKDEIGKIQTQHPKLKIVHTTVPLHAAPNDIKSKIKRMIGNLNWEDKSNIKRNNFNDLIRSEYPVSSVFDIAKLQSTLPNGERSVFSANNRRYYSLASIYTDDGGHLNETGRKYLAVKFIEFLADNLEN